MDSQKQNDFEIVVDSVKNYMQKWGDAHTVIIARNDFVEVLQGETGKPIEVKD